MTIEKTRHYNTKVDHDVVIDLLKNCDNTYNAIAEQVGCTRENVRLIGEREAPEVMAERKAEKRARAQRQTDFVEDAREAARIAALRTMKCYVCEREFTYDSRPLNKNRRFCSTDCHDLWARYLRYYLSPKLKVAQAQYTLRNQEKMIGTQVRDAQRILKEYEATGTVKPRRRLPSIPVQAQILAQRIGINLHKTRDRLMALEGAQYLPDSEGLPE
jgi:hypothetical protein